jgi:hypothetical protein
MSLEEKGINGIKRSEYVPPESVLGGEVRFEELPEGIRFYIKDQKVDLSTKRVEINLWQLVDEGGKKLNKEHCERFYNAPPDETYIALNYGPGDYVWIAKWVTFDGQHRGVQSETIPISKKWQARYEAYQRKQREADAAGFSSQAPSPAVPVAPQNSLTELLAVMEKAEDRAFNRMEQMSRIMGGNRDVTTPNQVLADAYKGATDMMLGAAKSNLEMLNSVKKKNIKELEREDDDLEDGDPEDGEEVALAGPPVPAFLAPFMPSLKGWLETLFKGGPIGAAAKTLIMSSEEFKAIAGDPEKKNQAIACFEGAFGREKTERAMKILLGEDVPEKTAKTAKTKTKGKGK